MSAVSDPPSDHDKKSAKPLLFSQVVRFKSSAQSSDALMMQSSAIKSKWVKWKEKNHEIRAGNPCTRGRDPDTERSTTLSPGGRAEFQHLTFGDGARRTCLSRYEMHDLATLHVAREGTRSLICLCHQNMEKFVQAGARVVSPDGTASPDQLERFSKSFTIGPARPPVLTRRMAVLRVGFEQVRHHRVQGLGDRHPSTSRGSKRQIESRVAVRQAFWEVHLQSPVSALEEALRGREEESEIAESSTAAGERICCFLVCAKDELFFVPPAHASLDPFRGEISCSVLCLFQRLRFLPGCNSKERVATGVQAQAPLSDAGRQECCSMFLQYMILFVEEDCLFGHLCKQGEACTASEATSRLVNETLKNRKNQGLGDP